MNLPHVSIIIPAFNEAKTIGEVVGISKNCELVGEIIVVDDGSNDNTAEVARAAGAEVAVLSLNRGKAQAMGAGVRMAKNEIICFLDADLKNFSVEILRKIIEPVLSRRYDMYAVIFGRRLWGLNWLTPRLPIISGNRALRKEVWQLAPEEYKIKFQIEIALNYFARRAKKKCGAESYPGFSQSIKEEKYGLIDCLWRRIKMSWDVIKIFTRLYIIENIKNWIKK